MSQNPTALEKDWGGKVIAFLLSLCLAVIWHSGDGARSQPRRDTGGTLSLSIHPDEGLRQIAHAVQKRADERKSGALPDPLAILAAAFALPQPQPFTTSSVGIAPRMAPLLGHPTRFARAPPMQHFA